MISKFLSGTILMIAIFNAYGMRCGNNLINEGDTYTKMIQLCGEPTQDTLSNVTYVNKDNDGMNYYIHVDGNGSIDSINFGRR